MVMTQAVKSPLTHVRHVGLGVPDFREVTAFYRTAWCLEVVHEEPDVVFFGTPASPEHYILRVRKDSDKRVDLIAFAAEGSSEVDHLAQRLGSAGVELEREPGTLSTPGGGYGFRCPAMSNSAARDHSNRGSLFRKSSAMSS
jgi:catechol 2,3-dioxygenase-like lactoylglutathione lyase family enzyme